MRVHLSLPVCSLTNPLADEWLFVFSLSFIAPPLAFVAKVGDNKTHTVIREIISQSSSDLRAEPEVKEAQSEPLPRCFPRNSLSGPSCTANLEGLFFFFAGRKVGLFLLSSLSDRMCENGTSLCLNVLKRSWGHQKTEFTPGGYGGSQCFLLPVAKGSATVDVPLSLETQADCGEEGREEDRAGWTKRGDFRGV